MAGRASVTCAAPFLAEVTRQAAETPDRRWLTLVGPAGEETHMVRALVDRMADYRAFYRSREVRPGDTILIILRESLDLFASFFAAIADGALPAYFAYPSPKQSEAAFLKAVDNLLLYNHIRLAIAFPEVVQILARSAAFARSSSEGCFAPSDVEPGRHPGPPAEAAELGFLQFSSGTTGAKKGVRISSRALFNQVAAYRPHVAFGPSSRIVSWLPHYHDMGLIACMLMPFLERVPIVMMSPFEWVKNPAMLLGAITRHRGTHVWLPNFALGHLARSVPDEGLDSYDLSSLEQIVCCSEPVLQETLSRFIERFSRVGIRPALFRNCFAMAENTFAMTTTGAGPVPFLALDQRALQEGRVVPVEHGERVVASAGAPLCNLQVKVIDGAGGDLGEDRLGEIAIRSDCMLDGYHNNPEETAKALVDGWFATGDIGFLHGGELHVYGRKKDLIIVAGENIYPQDVELILNEVEGLVPGRNVVFGVEDERIGTERIVALAEARDVAVPVDTTAIRTSVLARLNVALSEILLLPHMTLLKGTAGKISRYLNKIEYAKGAFAAVAVRERATPDTPGDVRGIVLTIVPDGARSVTSSDTPLLSSGLVDSFGFAELIARLEVFAGRPIPLELRSVRNFETIEAIERTITAIGEGRLEGLVDRSAIAGSRVQSLKRLKEGPPSQTAEYTPLERLINACPIHASWLYRFLLRRAGVRVGANVRFLGGVHVRLRGRPSNVVIGDHVIVGGGVDLRNRENGRITLGERVYLDANVRIVAARDGFVEIGSGSELGGGTIVNSGGRTRIGEYCLLAGNVQINASSHLTEPDRFIREQSYLHGFVEIGDDVWIGAGASILVNSRIGEGAVVGSNSVVSGELPPFSISLGVPAKVIRFR